MTPLHVGTDGRQRDHERERTDGDRAARGPPDAEQQPKRDHRHHRDSGAAVPHAEACREAGQSGPPRTPLGRPYRAIQHGAEQEYEQGIAKRRVLEEELIATQGDDRGWREPQCSRPSAAAHGEEEDHRGEQSQGVLHDRDENQMRGDRVQQAQEHRIPNGPNGVRPHRLQSAHEVDAAVGIPGERRSPDEQEPDPQQESHADQHGQRDEHAVARDTTPRSIARRPRRPRRAGSASAQAQAPEGADHGNQQLDASIIQVVATRPLEKRAPAVRHPRPGAPALPRSEPIARSNR